jgi:hypothetical protein
VLGYEPSECIGRTTEFLYPSKKEYLAIGNKIARAMAENKDVFHTEALLQNKNGDVFPADCVSLPQTCTIMSAIRWSWPACSWKTSRKPNPSWRKIS